MNTAYITEIQYLYFKENLKKVVVYTLLGFVVGSVVSYYFIVSSILYAAMFGALLAGIPYGWYVIPFYPFGLIGHIIKLILSLVLGWLVTPIAFIYHLVQVKRYECMIKKSEK